MATKAKLNAESPGEKIVLGLIGAGGRGSALAQAFASRPNVEVKCISDPDSRRSSSLAKAFQAKGYRVPEVVTEYRRMLDDKDVDAVIVATPDHWHALATIHACQAGKHVYVEKPASHNIWEGRKMVEAARRYNRVVQVGLQSRSAAYNQAALEYIRSGKLGAIHLCRVCNLKSGSPYRQSADSAPPADVDYDRWLGPAPKHTFNEGRFHRGWYYYFDYCGGDTGNDSSHQFDLARWLIGKEYPKSVLATGGKLAFPNADGDVPDTQTATFDFGDLLMTFELTQWAPYMDKIAMHVRNGDVFPYWPQCATRIEIYGAKGLMYVGRHGGGWQVFAAPKEQSGPGEVVAQHFGRVPDPEHQQDFLDSIRNNQKPNADIEAGHRSAILSHLANIATRLGGRRLVFDSSTETFVGDAEANAMLKRQYREPYVVPDKV